MFELLQEPVLLSYLLLHTAQQRENVGFVFQQEFKTDAVSMKIRMIVLRLENFTLHSPHILLHSSSFHWSSACNTFSQICLKYKVPTEYSFVNTFYHSVLKTKHSLKKYCTDEQILYVLVVELILRHAVSEKLLLHLQYRGLLSAQSLLLGVLHIYKHTQSPYLSRHPQSYSEGNHVNTCGPVSLTFTPCKFLISCLQRNNSL